MRIKRKILQTLQQQDVDPNAIAVWEWNAMTYGEACLFFLLQRHYKRLQRKKKKKALA
jgi:hypothetical protein